MTADVRAALRSVAHSPALQRLPAGLLVAFDADLRYLAAEPLPVGQGGRIWRELNGRTVHQLFTPDIVAVLEPLYRAALAGRDTACEVPFQDRVISQRLGPLRNAAGDIVAGVGFFQDVTEPRRAERELRVSEERFRVAFENGPVGLVIVSAQGRYLQVNTAMCAFLGCTRDELVGRRVADVTHPDDVDADRAARAALVAGERSSYTREKRYLTADGQLRWGMTSASVVRDQDGSPVHFIGQIVDVTAKKLDDQRLRDERRRLHDAEAVGRTGSWEMDIGTRAVSWSAGMFALYGVTPEEFGGDYDSAVRQVHPDDRLGVHAALDSSVRQGGATDHTFRIIRASDGTQRWLSGKSVVRSVDGHRTQIAGVVADVTESRRAAEEAVAAHAFQRAVFAASPDTIAVWDLTTWSVVWRNRAIAAHLGYSAEEAVALDADLVGSLVLPEDRAALMASIDAVRACADGEVAEVDFRMLHRDGTARWFSRRVAPLRRDAGGQVTHIVGISRDISGSKEVEAALVESQTRFRELAESVDVAFVLRSREPDELLYASPAFARMFGYDPLDVPREPDAALLQVHPDDRAAYERDYLGPPRSGQAAAAIYRIVRADGDVRWIRSRSSPVRDPSGRSRRTASTSEDITVSRQAEAALLSARAAEKANTAKNEFLSRMSHELRTPLNSVLGFAQLLELDELTDDQQLATRHILRAGRHLLGLIDDVLDISKIEDDRLDLALDSVPVDGLLGETVQLMALEADAAAVTLTYDPSAGATRPVLVNQRRLRQVLINLLSNAIKYNRAGGRVDVSTGISDDGQLEIVVRDTGRGIRAEHLPRLFTPFDRLDAGATGVAGTGVGLALSQRLMTQMGGRLVATSQWGSGSTFTASLPMAPVPWTDPRRAPDAGVSAAVVPEGVRSPDAVRPREVGNTPDARGTTGSLVAPTAGPLHPTRTLLYIEDNDANVELLATVLARRPHWSMVVAGEGALGLQLASTTQPDLVLLDLQLPDMTGLEVLQQLRRTPETDGLDVVIISADAGRQQVDRLLAAGAKAYLTKPVEIALLLDLLD